MSGKYGEVRSRKGIPQLKQGAYNPSPVYIEKIRLLNDIIAELKQEFTGSDFDLSFIFSVGVSSRKTKYTSVRYLRSQGYIESLVEAVQRLIVEKKTTGKTN